MRGRKPMPKTLRLTGTPHNLGDRPQGVVPDKPEWLDKYASLEWERLVPELAAAGYLAEVDGTILASYCVQYSLWRTATDMIRDQGIIEFGATGPHIHPAVKIQAGAAAEMRRIADEFGFTPAARSRIRVAGTGGGEQGDDFEGWQNGEGPRLADAN